MAADRMRKVNEEVRKQVAALLTRNERLPRDVFVTVNAVETTRNLRTTFVYISILPDGKRASTLKALGKAQSSLQKELGKKLQMKYTPRIEFVLDEGQIRAQGVFDVMDRD